MLLLVGLGNPGEHYDNTRHNVGFIVLDQIAQHYNIKFKYSNKFNAEIALTEVKTCFYARNKVLPKILLVKPQTFMNLSGEAISKICSYYKIINKNIFVIHDDLDLPIGKIKVKIGGGNAGHNGLKSLDRYITSNYYRIRVGIGRPQNPQIDIANYVLSKLLPSEYDKIEAQSKIITKNIYLLLENNIEKFKNVICHTKNNLCK